MSQNDSTNISASRTSRREWINELLKSGTCAALTLPQFAEASVFLDPDRYGDKELKIATVNKIRQNVRNAINNNPNLASAFLQIAILDALSYDPTTQEGGPDGTIIVRVLENSSNSPSLTTLKPAAEKLNEIAKLIKRTTEITMADLVTFAGAEAIESAGGPRVVVQLGKLDPKKSPNKSSSTSILIPSLNNDKDVVKSFINAGLTEREVAILFGALGSMDIIAKNTLNARKDDIDEDDDEPNEMGDVAVFIPSSFGAPKEIYGKQLGVMDNKFFSMVVADAKKGRAPVSAVFTDEKVMQWAKKYADNKNGFLKDLPEAYGKLMALGARYTGGKVGSLLGQGDAEL